MSTGEIRTAITALGDDVNCIQGVTRCGMGYDCQGRICATTVEYLTTQLLGRLPHEVGGFNVRPPIKPVAVLTQLDSCPRGAGAYDVRVARASSVTIHAIDVLRLCSAHSAGTQ